MKIVIDTNVVISGTFFGGAPRRVIESVGKNGIHACATPEIIEEYEEIVEEMIDRKQGAGLELIAPKTKVEVSRDPDDDKFIGCALDAKALYIVSGDKDLLDIGRYENVEMITAAEFCSRYLPL